MMTVGKHPTTVPPWAVLSPIRAAGMLPIKTVPDPLTMTSGGPTHTHMLPSVAAGMFPIITVTAPGEQIGPPTCGTTPVTIGQTCMSVSRAAGGMGFLVGSSMSSRVA